jgi:hypothetical protein
MPSLTLLSPLRAPALAVVVAATGCGMARAPGYVGPNEISTFQTKSRHQYHGFSVQPPTGLEWYLYVSEQKPDETVYRRRLASKTHTFLATVGLIQLDQSLPFEEAAAPHGLSDPSRFEELENTHQPDSSRKVPCIRYSLRLLDKHAPNSPDAPLQLVERGLVCAHPTFPGTAVRASFSERGLPEELDPGLWEDLEAFLKSVQIESAQGVPVART